MGWGHEIGDTGIPLTVLHRASGNGGAAGVGRGNNRAIEQGWVAKGPPPTADSGLRGGPSTQSTGASLRTDASRDLTKSPESSSTLVVATSVAATARRNCAKRWVY
jgi:hypothetical protein